MSSPTTNVFVSYSHADAFLVAPVVALLRVNASFVFQDITDIKPGKKWRREIDDALNKADLVVVFYGAITPINLITLRSSGYRPLIKKRIFYHSY